MRSRTVYIRANEGYKGKKLTPEQATALNNRIDITHTDRGRTALKLIREYQALLNKDIAKGNLSKTLAFAPWAKKKYGPRDMKTAQDVIDQFSHVKEFYTPSLSDARHSLVQKLIREANQGEKFVEAQTLLEKVNSVKGGRVRGGLFDYYRPALHTKADKVRKVFDNIVEADEIIEWPEKSTKFSKFATNPLDAMIGERSGVSNSQFARRVLSKNTKSGAYKPKHIYDKKLVNVAGNTRIIESGKPFSEIIEEAKYRAGGGVSWSKGSVRPDPANTINDFALRHWDYHQKHQTGKSQIEFFWNKRKDAKGNPLAVDWATVPKNKYGHKSLNTTLNLALN